MLSSANSDVAESVVLLISTFLLLAYATYIIYFNTHHQLDETSVKSKQHKLYVRLPTWVRQILLTLSLFVNIASCIYISQARSLPLQYIDLWGRILLGLVIALCAHFQDISILSKPAVLFLWLSWNFAFMLVTVLFFVSSISLESDIITVIAAVVSLLITTITALMPTYSLQQTSPTDEYTCGWFSYLSFSYINKPLVSVAVQKESVEYEDIPWLSDVDRAAILTEKLTTIARNNPRMTLTEKLFLLIRTEWATQAFFQFLGSVSGFIAPLALEKILIYVRYAGGEEYHQEGFLKINVWLAVFMIFLGPICKSIGDGQNYVRGRHIGIRVKAALIGLIYRKSLKIDLSASKESVGKLNNLISVDVGEIQSFCSYSHFMWSTPLEIFLASSLLFVVLGRAAVAGMMVMIVSLAIGLLIGKRLERLQDSMLQNKDKRMAIMHEVLHSIRIIKFYAWERQFNDKIGLARLQELASLLIYACTNIVLYIIWEIVPSLVAVIAFMTYTQFLGKPLTPALGFTAITLFQLLRFPLSVFPEMINLLVKSSISMKRIESYLRTANVKGLPTLDVFPDVATSSIGVNSHRVSDMQQKPTPLTGAIHLQNVTVAWRKVMKSSDEENEDNNESEDATQLCCAMESTGSKLSSALCCFSTRSPSGVSNATNTKPKKNRGNDRQEYQLLDKSDHDGVEMMKSFTIEDADDVEMKYEESLPSSFAHHSGPHMSTSVVKVESSHNKDKQQEELEQQQQHRIVLQGINVFFPPGALIVVIGGTGSGKSSLLQGGILGEGMILSGERFASGSISYASQSAWIQNATVRDNVLFGLPFDAVRYEAVLRACALKSDLALLPAGDMTEIGEKGVNLSGGQQQRVNLARAAYAQTDIILLDDPLSAVDAHVGDHIFTQLVRHYLVHRTRILATNNLALALPHADMIVCMDAQRQGILTCGDRDTVSRQLAAYVQDTSNTVVRDNSDNKAFYRGVLQILDAIVPVAMPSSVVPVSREVSDPHAPECTHEKITTVSLEESKEGPKEETASGQEVEEDEEMGSFLHRQPTSQQLSPSPLYSNLTRTFSGMLSLLPTATSVKQQQQKQTQSTKQKDGGMVYSPLTSNAAASTSPSSSYQGITERESKSTGDVPLSTYWFYLQAAGGGLVTLCLVIACLWIAFSWFLQNYCLGLWMEAMQQPHDSPHYKAHVHLNLQYYLLSVASVIVAYMSRTIFQNFCSIRAAQRIHNSLVRAVLLAPTHWFDATPIGRIINRFSQDISTVDSSVMNHLLDFTDCALGTLSVVCVISFVLPWLLLPLLPVLCFTGWVTYQYLRISRELKRWESIKKSPVFVLLTETLNGLNTVRAFRQEQSFFDTCCQRIDAMNQCHLYLWIANRWLNYRMQVLGALVAGLVGVGVVYYAGYSHLNDGDTTKGGMGAPAAGLVLLYSLNFCDNLTWLARTHADCQMDMNSVERLEEYSNVPSERYEVLEDETANHNKKTAAPSSSTTNDKGHMTQQSRRSQSKAVIDASRVLSFPELWQTMRLGHANETPTALAFQESTHRRHRNNTLVTTAAAPSTEASHWPTNGHIRFRGLSMRYKSAQSSEAPVLNQVSFEVAPREKLGVVGRTGAGKSSLIVALYRLVEPYEGEILIDDVNILQLPLYEIRANIAIVPQEPTLFKGTLRFNLDPFHEYRDLDIFEALQRVQLCDALGLTAAMRHLQDTVAVTVQDYDPNGALETFQVAEKGGNFSVGQRQLLCMARAILRRAKVLILDECTASVDHETDALIQDIVRDQLRDTTVICIAHRLHTVAYYDKVLVMDRGRAVECASPLELMLQETQKAQKESLFRSLCLASGAYDQLLSIAQEADMKRKEKKQQQQEQ